jgi:CheY-like chemotaxis protein
MTRNGAHDFGVRAHLSLFEATANVYEPTLDSLKSTVLIADDNPAILRALADLLRSSFTIVAEARDGEMAISVIKQLRPRLAILDVSMPKMNGFEVARHLSQAQHTTRVVFLTQLTGDEFVEVARRWGHGFVAKMRLDRDLPTGLQAALNGQFFTSPRSGTRRER